MLGTGRERGGRAKATDGYVLGTVARGREGVRNTSGFTQISQARGGAHLGLHCNHRVPQVWTSQPEVWSRRSVPFTGMNPLGHWLGWAIACDAC